MTFRAHKLIGLLIALAASWPGASLAQDDAAKLGSQELQHAAQVVQREGYSPARLLALGRAQLAQGQLGPAIVSFERGLVLAPRHAGLREALTQARTRAGLDAPGEGSWLSHILQDVSLGEWTYAASASSVALALTLLGLTLSARRRRLFAAGVFASALALATTAGATYAARQRLSTAFVLQEGSVLRQSPFATATVLGQLRPGELVEPQHEHGGFSYVQSERGQSGWILTQELAPLIRSST